MLPVRRTTRLRADGVGLVVELPDEVEDAAAGLGADAGRVVQDLGDGARGDRRHHGDVADGQRTARRSGFARPRVAFRPVLADLAAGRSVTACVLSTPAAHGGRS